MSRVVLKAIGVVSVALAVFLIPVSFMAGNPAVLGAAFGGLLSGALLVGFARVIALLEQIAENTRRPN